GDIRFAAALETHRHAGRLYDLRADYNLREQHIDAFRNLSAVLMAAGIQERLIHRQAVPDKLRHVAIARAYPVFSVEREFAPDHGSLLAGYRSKKAKPAL